MPDLQSSRSKASLAQAEHMAIAGHGSHSSGANDPLLAAAAPKSKNWIEYAWSAVGIVAVVVAGYMLYGLLAHTSPHDVSRAFTHIPPYRWALAIVGTLIAYATLAWYDRIALLHLGKPLNWLFISLTSFTTYALSHNIGASVFSGAAIRFRAYSTKGLSPAEIGVLVAFTAFTFTLGNVLLAAVVLVCAPHTIAYLLPINEETSRIIGGIALLAIALYVLGSWLELPPLDIRGFKIVYPRMPIAMRQLIAAPIELLGASAIIYFAMPAQENPGYFVVLSVYIIAFTAGLVSHAPGGLGVFEFSFFKLLPHLDDEQKAGLLAALFVWRLFYLMIPLALGIIIVMVFEKGRYVENAKQAAEPPAPQAPPAASEPPAASNVVTLDPMARRKPRHGAR